MAFFLGWHVANASESCLHVCVLELLVLFFLVVLSLLSVHTQNKGRERGERYNAHAFSSTVEIMIIIECLHLQIHSIFIGNRFTNGIRRKIGYYSGKKQTYPYYYIAACSSRNSEYKKKSSSNNNNRNLLCAIRNVSSRRICFHITQNTMPKKAHILHIGM